MAQTSSHAAAPNMMPPISAGGCAMDITIYYSKLDKTKQTINLFRYHGIF
jgi:hypothetical protein